MVDYTRDTEIENIADCQKGVTTILTTNKDILSKWQEMVPELLN